MPVTRLMTEAPYIPHMMKNQKGMQSFEELDPDTLAWACDKWFDCAKECRYTAGMLGEENIHKQWANRMLEWFGYIDVVVSSTYWKNYFNLRDHPAAMPEIQHLARAMHEAIDASTPRKVYFGDWHLPYIQVAEYGLPLEKKQLLSTARCARVSYKPFDSETADTEKDLELARRLILEDPLHASPAEHQATPDNVIGFAHVDNEVEWECPELHGNFFGWCQHRKYHANEAYNEDYSCKALYEYFQENFD